MFKRLVVGVDGSPSSLVAAKHAFRIGAHFGIPVVGIYVIDERLLDESFLLDLSSILGFTFYQGISARVKEVLEKQGDLILSEFAQLGRKEGVKVSIVQVQGIPWREIVNEADEEDLILMGKKGKKLVKGILVSGNAENVARSSRCPVFLFPEEDRQIKTACVAFDGRELSRRALIHAKELREVYDYGIKVLSVVEDSEQAKKLKEEAASLCGECEFFAYTGIPEEVIVRFCREKNVDLLFMGAFGKGSVREFFLGSVTSFVLHNLDLPLFLARKPHEG